MVLLGPCIIDKFPGWNVSVPHSRTVDDFIDQTKLLTSAHDTGIAGVLYIDSNPVRKFLST